MSSFKVHFLLLSLLLINFSESRSARPISLQQHSTNKLSSYLKMFETLGMVCKCCDGVVCSATWDGSCSNLKCFPWKSQ
uniref:Uncharacterized protein n=1 Tax=Solanum tuberosum TaxID=4113 RepID=M1C8Y8_SOLTU